MLCFPNVFAIRVANRKVGKSDAMSIVKNNIQEITQNFRRLPILVNIIHFLINNREQKKGNKMWVFYCVDLYNELHCFYNFVHYQIFDKIKMFT